MTYRKFKNFNLTEFRNDIFSTNWDSLRMFDNPNAMWHDRKNSFLGNVDKHAPLRSKRVSALKSPWVTPYLKQRMQRQSEVERNAIQ